LMVTGCVFNFRAISIRIRIETHYIQGIIIAGQRISEQYPSE